MCGVRHGSRVDPPYIQCLVSLEGFCSMNCALIRNMEGTLIACEEESLIHFRVSGIKAVHYGQV